MRGKEGLCDCVDLENSTLSSSKIALFSIPAILTGHGLATQKSLGHAEKENRILLSLKRRGFFASLSSKKQKTLTFILEEIYGGVQAVLKITALPKTGGAQFVHSRQRVFHISRPFRRELDR